MEPLRAVKGMTDILPDASPRWRLIEDAYREVTERYGYREIRTPAVEPTELFLRSIGSTTDIVEKEMYSFVDKGDASLSLRPEGTAAAVRAYIQHKVYAEEPVTKWRYSGAMYRRERPAKGRYRQFYQLGAELFADPGPFGDAELIEMLLSFLDRVGVKGATVYVNSLGSAEARASYRQALVDFLEPKRDSLSKDSQARLSRNPLRVLDSKDPGDQAIASEAPKVLDHLSEDDREHFDGLRKNLEALGVPYAVDTRLVRGLDYYNRTLFEVKVDAEALGAQNTLCGGGRYDTLVKSLGGPDVPAIGFAIGVERLLLIGAATAEGEPIDVWVACSDPDLRGAALPVLQTLRRDGFSAEADLRGTSLKSQLRRAHKAAARFAVILGEDEQARNAITLRDLASATQEELPLTELSARIQKGSAPG